MSFENVDSVVNILQLGLAVLSQQVLAFLVVILISGGFLFVFLTPSILGIITGATYAILLSIILIIAKFKK